MIKRALIVLLCCAGTVILTGCSILFPVTGQGDFVKVVGHHFEVDGHPLYYCGTNLWYGMYLGSPGPTGDRPRLLRELDSLKARGIVNLRVLGASEPSPIKATLKPPVQASPGMYDEDLLRGLDFLLAEMHKRDMRAVVFLNNYWEWSGGMAVYNLWAGDPAFPDVDNPAQGWGAFMDYAASFYTNQRANALYHNYVAMLIKRRNTITGTIYTDDPTIMSWQLANEPRPQRSGGIGSKSFNDFSAWLDSTAAYVHHLDPNHLVCSGSEGAVSTFWSDTALELSHRTKQIDYITFHLWPKNWSWFDPMRIGETYEPAKGKALAYINQHIRLGRRMNKPVVLEEFGIARDSAVCSPGAPSTARDDYYSTLLGVVYDSAKTGGAIAGTNFWGWGGEGKGKNADNVWRPGDPFTGDPPQEPQGYNSVFLGDSSTLAIISKHAARMLMLNAAGR
jgi:mannan endo-1,4-beta-mannosidase